MRFKFGKYLHAIGEVDLSRSIRITKSQATDLPIAYTHVWQIRGTLIAEVSTTKNIAKMERDLLNAYSLRNQDCGFLHDDGTKVDAAWLRSDDFIGGVIVTSPPSFPSREQAQGVTHSNYVIGLEATSIASDSGNLREFSETISFSGGGPLYMHLEPIYGAPVKILAKQRTVYRAVQRGRSVGYLSRPDARPPLWPAALMRAPQVTYFGPRMENGVPVDFGIEWSYDFESGNPLYA